jgi:hypothetical protein
VKAAQCKVVLDTEQHPAQPLTELFGDFLYAYQTAGAYIQATGAVMVFVVISSSASIRAERTLTLLE